MSGRVEQNLLTAQLQRARDTLTASIATQSTAEEQKRLSLEQIRTIQEQIKSGETTGDRLQDLLIVRYGLKAPDYEERYRNMQEQVLSNHGQFILIVGKREHFDGCIGFGYRPSDRDYSLETALALGVQEGNELVIDATGKQTSPYPLMYSRGFGDGICDFPTQQYSHIPGWRRRIDTQQSDLPADLTYLGEELDIRNILHANIDGSRPKRLEVFVGNQSVINWFAQQEVRPWEKVEVAKPTPLLERMADAIGKPINGQTRFRI